MSAVTVSDHALIRFLERSGNLDLEALRGEIAAALDRAAAASAALDRAAAASAAIGVEDYLITADGLVYVVRGGTVTTVFTRGSRAARLRACKRPEKR